MTVKELVERYHLFKAWRNVDGKPVAGVGTYNKEAEEVFDEIVARKEEILAYLNEREEAKRREYKTLTPAAEIDAIEGLTEIRRAQEELIEWRRKFNASFEGDGAVGGLGVGRKPEHDIDTMMQKYPRAAAYLKAEVMANKENIELANIGKKALKEVVNGDYTKAMADMQAAEKAFVNRHIWD